MTKNIQSGKQQNSFDCRESETRVLKDLLKKVSAHARAMEAELDAASRETIRLREQLRQSRIELKNVYNSRSWKITWPVRFLSRMIKAMFRLSKSPSLSSGNRVKALRSGNNSPRNNRAGQNSAGRDKRKAGFPGPDLGILSPREKEILKKLKNSPREETAGE